MTGRSIWTIASRLFASSLLMLAIVTAAHAYTIVMRDGRRVEIPSNFVVTPSTLTYEVQQGIQVTLQVAAINVEATEKANGELPGAFLGRATPVPAVNANVSGSQSQTAKRTITNRDLEASARRRIASELAYEKRTKELGLPSLEESRRQAEAAAATAQEQLHQRLETAKETEEYWRARATTFRTEMAALDAEIRFVRSKLDEMPVINWSGGFNSFSGIVPFISFGGGGGRHFSGSRRHGPGVYSARVGAGPQLSGRIGFSGGARRAPVFVNPGRGGRGHFGQGPGWGRRSGVGVTLGSNIGIYPTTPLLGSTGGYEYSGGYDYSYERSELVTRFNELGAARAGLNARWRELEEEARRAGAAPGWLRK